VEPWSGVRNYMARFYMRAMQIGDEVLFHHSNVDPPGVAGLARVVRTGVLDEKQFDPQSDYYDPKATRDKPIWDCVDVEYVGKLPHFVSMDRMRAEPACADMFVLRRGMRLSVQPVTPAEFAAVVALGNTPPPPELEGKPKPPKGSKPSKAAAAKPSKAKPASKPPKPPKPPKPAKKPKPGTAKQPKLAKSSKPAATPSRASKPAKR
jgi:predicted RNA-binding protein with PUA-like domain